jgi:hypothetical protein
VIEEGKITRNLDPDGLRRRVSVRVPVRGLRANGLLGFLNGRSNGRPKEHEKAAPKNRERDN